MHTGIDFYFDYGSPASYLAYMRLPAIAGRTGAQINYRPILLGGVLKATGNAAPTAIPAKKEWLLADLSRWAKRYGTPFQMNVLFSYRHLEFDAWRDRHAKSRPVQGVFRHRLSSDLG